MNSNTLSIKSYETPTSESPYLIMHRFVHTRVLKINIWQEMNLKNSASINSARIFRKFAASVFVFRRIFFEKLHEFVAPAKRPQPCTVDLPQTISETFNSVSSPEIMANHQTRIELGEFKFFAGWKQMKNICQTNIKTTLLYNLDAINKS